MTASVVSTPSALSLRPRPRLWAVSGLFAAIGSIASVFLSMSLSPEYIRGSVITSEAINAGLMDRRPLLIAFHVVTLASALLIVVFAAGLHRRLHASTGAQSTAPLIAFAGLLLVAAAQVLGSGLDTEFLFGIDDTAINLPGDIGMYSHWIATIPWLWAGGGLAALAVGVASRAGAAPRWIGITGFAFGGTTVLLALSPLQYMAALPGSLWLLVTALGFAVGDRHASRHR